MKIQIQQHYLIRNPPSLSSTKMAHKLLMSSMTSLVGLNVYQKLVAQHFLSPFFLKSHTTEGHRVTHFTAKYELSLLEDCPFKTSPWPLTYGSYFLIGVVPNKPSPADFCALTTGWEEGFNTWTLFQTLNTFIYLSIYLFM